MAGVTIADCIKLQMDAFYSNPRLVAEAYIATGRKQILREAKKRGLDLAPHLRRYFENFRAIAQGDKKQQ